MAVVVAAAAAAADTALVAVEAPAVAPAVVADVAARKIAGVVADVTAVVVPAVVVSAKAMTVARRFAADAADVDTYSVFVKGAGGLSPVFVGKEVAFRHCGFAGDLERSPGQAC